MPKSRRARDSRAIPAFLAHALRGAARRLRSALPALAAPQKVLRVPFLIAETNFDPAFASDLYSNNVIDEIFEPPLTYDFLARPDEAQARRRSRRCRRSPTAGAPTRSA